MKHKYMSGKHICNTDFEKQKKHVGSTYIFRTQIIRYHGLRKKEFLVLEVPWMISRRLLKMQDD